MMIKLIPYVLIFLNRLQPEDDFAQIDAFQTVAKGASPIIGGKPVVAKPKVDPTAPLKVEEVTKKPEPV